MPPDPAASQRPVPWRTIFAVIGSVVLTVAVYKVVLQVSRILVWMIIAGFFAVVLSPPVDFLERRCRIRRGLGTLVVFFVGFGALSAVVYAFVTPIVDQSQEFADNFPRYVEDAKAGRGPLGGLVKRYDLDRRLEDRQDDIKDALENLGENSLSILQGVGNAVAATLTIVVLTILMLLSGPKMLQGGLGALSPPTRERVRLVAADAAKAVTGYVAGNLLISVIAGATAFAFLFFTGVPFRGVLALWVAFADLIPLVGATLGAIPAVAVAFLHSTGVGIATVVFFIMYQQFENHVLQVTIMSRTVDLNPLVVLISVLIGVELSGILGALLAIPAAGVVNVVARDLYDERRGALKPEPTVGVEEVPVSQVPADGAVPAKEAVL
ncbi:MAG: AI-2E family transporter [Actinomycetota bacterium]|nr:AI-2E family transporter [Actinomycetota bacterium]PLS74764.1 MAG: AI-2E family transporter [Actinomycetota bacterium]